MANILLQKPATGQQATLVPQTEDRLVFEFDSSDATLSRDGDSLLMSFEDGSSLLLTDFYVTYTSENMPTFLIEGAEVEGEAFFAALGEELMPAAGAVEAPEGSGSSFSLEDANLLGGLTRTGGLDQDGTNSAENDNLVNTPRSTTPNVINEDTGAGGPVGDGAGGGTGDGTGDGTGGTQEPLPNDVPEALTDKMAIIAGADHKGNDFSKHFDEGNDAEGGRYILVDNDGKEMAPTKVNADGTLTYELFSSSGKNWGSITFAPSTGKYEVEADGSWSSEKTFNVAFEDNNGDVSSAIQVDVSKVNGISFREDNLENGTNPDATATVKTWSPPSGYTIDLEKFETGTFTGSHGEKYTVEVVNGKLQFTLHSAADNPTAGGVGSDGANHWNSVTSIDIPLLDEDKNAHDLTITMGVVDGAPKISTELDGKTEIDLSLDSNGIIDLSQLFNYGADGMGFVYLTTGHTNNSVVDANGNSKYDYDWGTLYLNKSTGKMTFELHADYEGPLPEIHVATTDADGDIVTGGVTVTLTGAGANIDELDMSTLLKDSSTEHFEAQVGDALESDIAEQNLATEIQAVLEASPDTLATASTHLEKAAEAMETSPASEDTFYGNSTEDLLLGLDGDDALYGGAGDDLLLGGTGNDVLDGGKDADIILGGSGSDVIVLDLQDLFVDAGEDADNMDIDILLGQGSYNMEDVTEAMGESNAEMAIYGDVRANGQDADSLMAELGITKGDDGKVTMGDEWGQGQPSGGNYTAFTQNAGTDQQVTVLVESIKLTSAM